jgi:hypothetical protein
MSKKDTTQIKHSQLINHSALGLSLCLAEVLQIIPPTNNIFLQHFLEPDASWNFALKCQSQSSHGDNRHFPQVCDWFISSFLSLGIRRARIQAIQHFDRASHRIRRILAISKPSEMCMEIDSHFWWPALHSRNGTMRSVEAVFEPS